MKISLILLSLIVVSLQLPGQSLMRSDDLGQSWSMMKLIPEEAQVNFINVIEGDLLIGTENLGLFLNDRNISDLLPGKKVNGLLVQGTIIYTSIFKQGLFRTENKGFTWEKINDEEVRGLFCINGRLLLGSDNGIFLLSEGKWLQVFSEGQVVSIIGSGDRIIAGTSKGLLMSADEGQTWNWIHKKGAVHNLAESKGRIYSLNVSGDLISTSDWGRTWERSDKSLETGSELYDLIEVGGQKILTCRQGVFITQEDASWTNVYKDEKFVFYDLFEFDGQIYGGTRPK